MIPLWLHQCAIVALAAGGICAIIIAVDEYRHPQRMWIMNLVWPTTALFGAAFVVWGYFKFGLPGSRRISSPSQASVRIPFSVVVAKGTLHCGAGCTLGDISAEWLAYAVPAIPVWLGWQRFFEVKMFSVWILDYLFAFGFGIVFQYFAIKPMRSFSARDALIAALKADAVSLSAWQLGMYGFMAFAGLFIFDHEFGSPLSVDSIEFWFMMQIAMFFGFATAYPVNWFLIRRGIKDCM